jgi:hypothetical protein
MTLSCRAILEAILPMVTAPNNRKVASAEHKYEINVYDIEETDKTIITFQIKN